MDLNVGLIVLGGFVFCAGVTVLVVRLQSNLKTELDDFIHALEGLCLTSGAFLALFGGVMFVGAITRLVGVVLALLGLAAAYYLLSSVLDYTRWRSAVSSSLEGPGI